MRMLIPKSAAFAWPHRSHPSLFDDFDQLMDGFSKSRLTNSENFHPACDINETKDNFLISFDVPGVSKENIKVEVSNNQLIVSGERQQKVKTNSEDSTVRHERVYGSFQRAFTLPTTVNADKIEANHQDGVLEIMIPKGESARSRSIEVQSGKNGFFSKLLGQKDSVKKDTTESDELAS